MESFILKLSDIATISPEMQLLIWGCAILLAMVFLREKERYDWVPFLFALVGLGASGISLVQQCLDYVASGQPEGLTASFNHAYTLDGASLFFKAIFLSAGFLTVLISHRFMREEKANPSEFYAILLIGISAMMFLAGGMDLITLYISLEFMAISVYILVGYLKKQPRATEASLKYFVLGAFSSGLLLFGLSFIYGLAGTTNLPRLYEVLNGAGDLNRQILSMALFLVMAGVGFKIAAVPFHMWCPDAYEGAPTPFTAFMSVAPKAAGFALFMRLFLFVFKPVEPLYVSLLGLLSIVTMTMGNILAVRQTNIKRMLAYSSISHAGFILMGMMVRDQMGLQAIGVYLACYLFMNIGAFAVVVLMNRQGTAGEELDDYNGLVHRHPAIAVCMIIFLLSMSGIPPMAGFLAKYWVFSCVIKNYLATNDRLFLWVAVAGALNAVVALYYYFRVVKRMFMGEQTGPESLALSPANVLALALTVGGTLLLGLYPDPLIQFASWIGRSFTGTY